MPATSAPEVLETARLRLEPLARADLAALHAIYADPATWRHLPVGRHGTLEQSERLIDQSEASWAASGLGRWAIRLRSPLAGPGPDRPGLPAGAFIGVASATLLECGARNLGYRLTPASWGAGFATEAAAAVLAVATPSALPVTARALAANPASVRVLERIGLIRLWSGSGQSDTALDRVVFADRPLAPDLLAAIIRLG